MSAQLDRELGDVGKWWNEHKEEVSDLEQRQKFLVRAFEHLLWLNARMVEDIKVLERRQHPGRDIDARAVKSRIIMPR